MMLLAGIDLRGRRVLITRVSAGLAWRRRGRWRRMAPKWSAPCATSPSGAGNRAGSRGGEEWRRFELVELDLASLKSVRACADALVAAAAPLTP